MDNSFDDPGYYNQVGGGGGRGTGSSSGSNSSREVLEGLEVRLCMGFRMINIYILYIALRKCAIARRDSKDLLEIRPTVLLTRFSKTFGY